ncbi:hypothetical protein, partial [Vibrio cholerae]|uniref:hypothetical protein n=1 Tax=Vibrio cholerae TaxID=666 RepID=UPI001F337FE3
CAADQFGSLKFVRAADRDYRRSVGSYCASLCVPSIPFLLEVAGVLAATPSRLRLGDIFIIF